MSLHDDPIEDLKRVQYDSTWEYSDNFSQSLSDQEYYNLILNMGQQIIRWLSKIHSLGYVHGDIKPANILYNSEPNNPVFVLIDFGISQMFLDSDGQHKYREFLPKFRGNIEFAAFEWLQKLCKLLIIFMQF